MDPFPRNQPPATREGFLYSQIKTTVDLDLSPKFQYMLYEYSV